MTTIELQILKNKMAIHKMNKEIKNVEEAHVIDESPVVQTGEYVFKVTQDSVNKNLEFSKSENGFTLYEIMGFLQVELASITVRILSTFTPKV